MRRLFLVTLLLSLAPAVLAAPSSAAAVNCGDVITSDTTLTADLIGCAGNGLDIDAPGITLDLNGHTISGTSFDTGAGVGILIGASGVTVKGGKVTGFGSGVRSETNFSPTPQPITVEDMVIDANRVGVTAEFAGSVLYLNNTISNNGFGGAVYKLVSTQVFKGNAIFGNGTLCFPPHVPKHCGTGISALARGVYEDNTITGNWGAGLYLAFSSSSITNNVVSGNGGDGISWGEPDPTVRLLSSAASPSATCISGLSIASNTANGNAGHGIAVYVPPTDCPYDLGGNKASFNQTEPQCINVNCTSETDNSPPLCKLIAINPGPPKKVLIAIQDAISGLQDVTVTTKTNANVDVSSFVKGTTDTILVTGTKLLQALPSVVALRVRDMAGNVTECDPVIPGAGKAVHRRRSDNRR